MFLKPGAIKANQNSLVAPTGSVRAWRFVIEDFVPLLA
jgi:hypothetical protein